jgi:hypothetical protein
VQGALVRRAEEYYISLKCKEDRETFRRLVSMLVSATPFKITSLAITRRVLESELGPKTKDLAGYLAAETFLLASGEDPLIRERTFEFTNEALIRAWPRVEKWVKETEKWSVWYQTIFFPLYRLWRGRERAPEFLKSEDILKEAQAWLVSDGTLFEGEVRDFLAESIFAKWQAGVSQEKQLREKIADSRKRGMH